MGFSRFFFEASLLFLYLGLLWGSFRVLFWSFQNEGFSVFRYPSSEYHYFVIIWLFVATLSNLLVLFFKKGSIKFWPWVVQTLRDKKYDIPDTAEEIYSML